MMVHFRKRFFEKDLKRISELIAERGKAMVIEAISSLSDDDSDDPGTDERTQMSGDNEVGRSATNSLAGWVSAGVPGADAQGPGDAGTTDESPTQPVHGETTRWQQPGGCCRSGGHFSAQCPPD
jgi:hypothetical protein